MNTQAHHNPKRVSTSAGVVWRCGRCGVSSAYAMAFDDLDCVAECPWCNALVAARGDTCDETCYRQWLGTYNGIIADDVEVPREHWLQPWYDGSRYGNH